MAQNLKYSANFKRNYVAFFALVLFLAMILVELTIALSIPYFVQRENAYTQDILKREMMLRFDSARVLCFSIKEDNESVKMEKKLLVDTLDYLAIYLRREADNLTAEEVELLSPQIIELYKIAARLEKGKPYSRENTLNSATYLNSLLKKIKP